MYSRQGMRQGGSRRAQGPGPRATAPWPKRNSGMGESNKSAAEAAAGGGGDGAVPNQRPCDDIRLRSEPQFHLPLHCEVLCSVIPVVECQTCRRLTSQAQLYFA